MSSGNLFIFKNKTEQGNNSTGSQAFNMFMEKKCWDFQLLGFHLTDHLTLSV